jgi:NAD(P)-dependent dehydrogenase (short-subunit alcohol dehydrogenase family)
MLSIMDVIYMMCEEKVAIVTGAAGSGMGRSIALTLGREGASVVVNYRKSQENAQEIVKHLESRNVKAIAVDADIFTEDGCKNLVDETINHFGQVDICVIGPGGGWHPETLDKLDPRSALEDMFQEMAPLYYLMPLVLPGMYERKWGRLVGIGLHPTKLPPVYSYNAAKMARNQALLLAHEQAWDYGVTVNVIAPGPVPEIESLEEAIEYCDQKTPWIDRKTTSPQDIAEGVAFLCSEAGKFISGCILPFLFNE